MLGDPKTKMDMNAKTNNIYVQTIIIDPSILNDC